MTTDDAQKLQRFFSLLEGQDKEKPHHALAVCLAAIDAAPILQQRLEGCRLAYRALNEGRHTAALELLAELGEGENDLRVPGL